MKIISKTSGFGFAASVITIAMSACSSGHVDGVALNGTLKADSIQDFVLTYNQDGDINNFRTIDITRNDDGSFQIPDSLLPAEGTHATIMADEAGYFGVWVEPGKTVTMDIAPGDDGKLSATFSGENADVNKYYNALTQTYDIMVFTPQDPSERMPYEEAMKYLEECQTKLTGMLPDIKDEQKRKYYTDLTNLLYRRMKGFIIEDDAYDSDQNPSDNPEYIALTKDIDPNDPASLDSNMIYLWLTNNTKDIEGSEMEKTIERLKFVDQNITNPRTRKALVHILPHQFFAYTKPSQEDAENFMKFYCEFAKDYPEFIDQFTLSAQSVREIKAGDRFAYDPELVSPDGKKCKLSDLFGETLYIDFWATWCGPCCKQIPHLEKLVEKMKDVKGLKFVSISCDTDVDAWKAKLAKDNPDWPQYIFAPGDGDKFMEVMNITGIPRFMIVAPDGAMIAPEADFPSNPKLEQQLRALVK